MPSKFFVVVSSLAGETGQAFRNDASHKCGAFVPVAREPDACYNGGRFHPGALRR